MPQPQRSSANYRVYGEKDLERLKFIRHCRLHGMTLDEIKELISIGEIAGHKCAVVHKLMDRHIKNIDAQIAQLNNLKNALMKMRDSCSGGQDSCEVLNNLKSWEKCAFCSHHNAKGTRASHEHA